MNGAAVDLHSDVGAGTRLVSQFRRTQIFRRRRFLVLAWLVPILAIISVTEGVLLAIEWGWLS